MYRRYLIQSTFALTLLSCLYAGAVQANPKGGQVLAGTASIVNGTNTTVITQSSDKAILHWSDFSIQAHESVTFVQPNQSSIALNRIVGSNPSQILGQLSANGQVFLLNPRGVFFGPNAHVDVAGLVASTLHITDADFLAGQYRFTQTPDSTGQIMNAGNIQTTEGGYIVLLGDQVENEGVLLAQLGAVVLASGDQVSLDLQGDGLIQFAVDAATLSDLAAVRNQGDIIAEGGRVLMTAKVSQTLLSTVVKNEGLVQANSIVDHAGEVFLVAQGGDVIHSGIIDVSGEQADGGRVRILGDRVGVMGSAVINASGNNGGQINVGGDFQGQGALQLASHTSVLSGAKIQADGHIGAGGQVIFWADDVMRFAGHISATGEHGDGGFVEVSGKHTLRFTGFVDTQSTFAESGSLLLDPDDIFISGSPGIDDCGVAADQSCLFADVSGGFVTISADILEALSSNVILQAENDIAVDGLADGSLDFSLLGSGESVKFQAGGSIFFNGAALSTNGADVFLQALSPDATLQGSGVIDIDGINANGGNITLLGQSLSLGGAYAGRNIALGQALVGFPFTSAKDVSFFDASIDVTGLARMVATERVNFFGNNVVNAGDIIFGGPATFGVNIADNAVLNTVRDVTFNSDLNIGQGAALSIDAGRNIAVNADLILQADGRQGFSTLTLDAQQDIVLNGKVDLTRGEAFVNMLSGRDTIINAGFNGDGTNVFIDQLIGRDFRVSGGLVIRADAVQGQAAGGFVAGRDVVLIGDTEVKGDVAFLDILFNAGRNFVFDGVFTSAIPQTEINVTAGNNIALRGALTVGRAIDLRAISGDIVLNVNMFSESNIFDAKNGNITQPSGQITSQEGILVIGKNVALSSLEARQNEFFATGELNAAGNEAGGNVAIVVLAQGTAVLGNLVADAKPGLNIFVDPVDIVIRNNITASGNAAFLATNDITVTNGAIIKAGGALVLTADLDENVLGDFVADAGTVLIAQNIQLQGRQVIVNGVTSVAPINTQTLVLDEVLAQELSAIVDQVLNDDTFDFVNKKQDFKQGFKQKLIEEVLAPDADAEDNAEANDSEPESGSELEGEKEEKEEEDALVNQAQEDEEGALEDQPLVSLSDEGGGVGAACTP